MNTSNLTNVKIGRYKIDYKSDGIPDTTPDVLIESLIRSYLDKLMPSRRFIDEESFDFRSETKDGYLAILDLIDGIESFCSGLKEWGVFEPVAWPDAFRQYIDDARIRRKP